MALAIAKHLPRSVAMAKRHLDQTQKNWPPTKRDQQEEELPTEPMPQEPNNVKTNQVFTAIKEVG